MSSVGRIVGYSINTVTELLRDVRLSHACFIRSG